MILWTISVLIVFGCQATLLLIQIESLFLSFYFSIKQSQCVIAKGISHVSFVGGFNFTELFANCRRKLSVTHGSMFIIILKARYN